MKFTIAQKRKETNVVWFWCPTPI